MSAIDRLRGTLGGRSDGGFTHRLILANSSALVSTTLVTSLLGAAYWWVAARAFTPDAVGLAGAAVSVMTLLATFGLLGLGTLLMGELPRRRHEAGSLITTALLAAGIAGAVLGLAFSLVAPRLSTQLDPLGGHNALLFAGGVSLTAVGLVLDQALVGLLRGGLQLSRNAVLGVAKLGALAVTPLLVGGGHGMAIYATWVVGSAVSLAAVLLLGDRGLPNVGSWRPRPSVLQELRGAAVGHHLFNLALQAPGLALPMLVAALLSTETNAAFFIAWMVAGFVWAVPLALTQVLFAVGAADRAGLAHKIRFTLRVSVLTSVAANLVLLLAAEPVLRIFGSHYAGTAVHTLQLLGLAVLPLIVKTHYVAVRRISGRLGSAIALVVVGAVAELTLAVIGAETHGLDGLSVGLAAALTLEALLMARPVLAAARLPAPSPAERAGAVVRLRLDPDLDEEQRAHDRRAATAGAVDRLDAQRPATGDELG